MGCDWRTATMQDSIMKPNFEVRASSASGVLGFLIGISGGH